MGILRVVVICLFLGKAWQYLRWGTPNDQLPLSPFLISVLNGILVSVYLICASLAAGVYRQLPKALVRLVIYIGVACLFSQTVLSFWQSGWELPQLIEHTLQWSIPLFWLYLNLEGSVPTKQVTFFMLLAIALTFLGHGLYAAGIWDQPAHFIGMTKSILGLSIPNSQKFLVVAGILDFCVAIGIFFMKVRNPLLLYAALWGTLTALARLVGHWEWENPIASLDRWGFEVLFRLGHGGIPFLIWWNQKNK